MLDQLFEIVKTKVNTIPVNADNIANMKVGPMKFAISCYDLEGIGRMSLMKGTAMMGLMKMDTLMLTPSKKDAPIISYDRIHAMGNDTLIIEMYDTCLSHREYRELSEISEQYKDLPDKDPGEHWYDTIKCPESLSKKGKKITERLDQLTLAYISKYLDLTIAAEDVDLKQKTENNKEYVDGLLSNGGPSTDQFVKKIGKTATEELFRKYLFGTEV